MQVAETQRAEPRGPTMPAAALPDGGPTLVSLFSGAGGLDIGLELAGLRTVLAVDADPRCVETLLANQRHGIPKPGGDTFLGGARILAADVGALGAGDLLHDLCPGGRPTVLAGGPPCQPFSPAGKMLGLSDPRGRLFEHFVRLAAELGPDFLLFENVRGLVTAQGPSGTPGEALRLVGEAFEAVGYATSFGLLNAADWGCPQRRVRLFMLGARRDGRHALPLFPQPTHSEDGEGGLFSPALPWRPLREVLEADPDPADLVRPSVKLAPLLAGIPPGSGLRSEGARETTRPGGHWGYRQGTYVANLDRPARTVTASPAQDWVRLPDGTHRRLTWRECARLQGFPEEWAFTGNRDDKYRQVGNAVPVVLGAVLGRAILESAARGEASSPVASAPLPRGFQAAVAQTLREHARNGESRARVRELARTGGGPTHEYKGRGRPEGPGPHARFPRAPTV